MSERSVRTRLATQFPALHDVAQRARGVADRALDIEAILDGTNHQVERVADATAPQQILIIGVYEPESDMPGEIDGLRRTKHHVNFALGSRKGPALPHLTAETLIQDMDGLMLENANRLLDEARPLAAQADWVIRIDSDVRFPSRFLDRFVGVAKYLDFAICAPALSRRSYRGWDVTRRQPGLIARATNFVEIGPVCAFRNDAAARLLPFPEGSGMGWGLDLHWPALAKESGWKLGIIDATPIRHERFPWTTYSFDAAFRAETHFLKSRPHISRESVRTLSRFRRLEPQ